MRKILRGTIGTFLILAVIGCALFLYVLLHAPVFESGENYTFYLGANSSSLSVTSKTPVLDKLKLGAVKGESVQYSGDRLGELREKYCAELLFTEEACGVINYYFYSPKLHDAVELNGVAVNLHIAVSAEKTVAGTPLIFGGF